MKEVLWQRWLDALLSERDHRQGASSQADEARQWLNATLDAMAERMRASPDWIEPTEEERCAGLASLEAWFREHGYPQAAAICAELRKAMD